jgi:hypothetical protein
MRDVKFPRLKYPLKIAKTFSLGHAELVSASHEIPKPSDAKALAGRPACHRYAKALAGRQVRDDEKFHITCKQ